MSVFDLRAFYKPKGSNPEIGGAYYELASQQKIHGLWNCEVLSLGFAKGAFTRQLRFRPIDSMKPIVFAIDGVTDGNNFTVVDAHIDPDKVTGGMHNYKPFRTDDFIVDCYDGAGIGQNKPNYWSVTKEGLTFVCGAAFPDTWAIKDCDQLCALVGGGLTPNQLRMHAYLTERQASRERRLSERMPEIIGEFARRIANAEQRLATNLSIFRNLNQLLYIDRWPLVFKSTVRALIEGDTYK